MIPPVALSSLRFSRSLAVLALLAASLPAAELRGQNRDVGTARVLGAPAKPRRRPKILPGNAVELKTNDGWTLAAQYQPAKPGRLTVVLLHQTGGRKEDWYYLAKGLVRRGFGVFALDLRGHGASQKPPPGGEPNWRKFRAEKSYNEWINMALDVQAAFDYLIGQGVSESSIALGGADVGSSLALRYAAVHPKVPLVFMLSPGMAYREVLTVNAVRAYGKRPILLVVGSDDKHSVPETTILYAFAKRAAGSENTTLITAEREHGTRMLVRNKGLITRIADWVDNPARPAETPAVSTPTPGRSQGLPFDEELENGAPGATPSSSEESQDSADGPSIQ